jgi:hypothetical protein
LNIGLDLLKELRREEFVGIEIWHSFLARYSDPRERAWDRYIRPKLECRLIENGSARLQAAPMVVDVSMFLFFMRRLLEDEISDDAMRTRLM